MNSNKKIYCNKSNGSLEIIIIFIKVVGFVSAFMLWFLTTFKTERAFKYCYNSIFFFFLSFFPFSQVQNFRSIEFGQKENDEYTHMKQVKVELQKDTTKKGKGKRQQSQINVYSTHTHTYVYSRKH